jgi:hypothetical protein
VKLRGRMKLEVFEDWSLSCQVVGVLENMLLAMGTLLRILDWLLYLPTCLVWLVMMCPRDQERVR